MANKRTVKKPRYTSFKLNKRIKAAPDQRQVASAWKLLKQTAGVLRNNWKLFGGLLAVYVLLMITVLGGFGFSNNITTLKNEAAVTTGSGENSFAVGLSVFTSLLGGGGESTEGSGVFQFFLIIIFSLAVIWALRQVQAGKQASVRDSFYKGMTPLVPFLLVLLVIFLQLLPLLVGNFAYSLLAYGDVAAVAAEKVIWGVFAGLLALLSLYMISSSIIALYIVTLPGMRPMQALRSAREVVHHRRFLVLRKVLALPIALLLVLAFLVVPLIIIVPVVAQTIFFVLSTGSLMIAHIYLYSLYRELL